MTHNIASGCVQAEPQTFERWWNSHGEWVEQPNQRRGGESGVQRLRPAKPGNPVLYLKRQTGHLYRSLLHPFGRPTVLREQRALRTLAGLGIGVPRVVYCAAYKHQGQWQALLVTEALEGFVSLDDWYASAAPTRHGSESQRQVLKQLARTLSRLHLHGWQHGCCYPKHIFVKLDDRSGAARAEVALLDLEKSRRRFSSSASRHDLRQLRRHRGAMPEADWQAFIEMYLQNFSRAAL